MRAFKLPIVSITTCRTFTNWHANHICEDAYLTKIAISAHISQAQVYHLQYGSFRRPLLSITSETTDTKLRSPIALQFLNIQPSTLQKATRWHLHLTQLFKQPHLHMLITSIMTRHKLNHHLCKSMNAPTLTLRNRYYTSSQKAIISASTFNELRSPLAVRYTSHNASACFKHQSFTSFLLTPRGRVSD